MKLIRIVLLPFSVLYGLILKVRHQLYDWGWLKEHTFKQPVICVGNLSVGGTGKTPFTIFLAKLLGDHPQLAILSRGYKRKTFGFVMAESKSTPDLIGDEPLLMFQKLQYTLLAVDEDRKRGLQKLFNDYQVTTAILDDAFQHRRVKAPLNILLTDFRNLYTRNWLLPAGNLRDVRQRAKAAQMIVVTKCPEEVDFSAIEQEINPHENQHVFFTRLNYKTLHPLLGDQEFDPEFMRDKGVVLFTGIAQPKYLEDYIRSKTQILKTVNFRDHHDYQPKDIQSITEIFDNFEASPKLVVTTEKDAVKLLNSTLAPLLVKLPIFVLTIEVEFLKDKELFESELEKYAKKN